MQVSSSILTRPVQISSTRPVTYSRPTRSGPVITSDAHDTGWRADAEEVVVACIPQIPTIAAATRHEKVRIGVTSMRIRPGHKDETG